jgi:hypothetical protein
MRDQDLKRLEQPYSTEPDGTPKSDFPAALGLTLTNLRRLDAAVRSDLDFNTGSVGGGSRTSRSSNFSSGSSSPTTSSLRSTGSSRT